MLAEDTAGFTSMALGQGNPDDNLFVKFYTHPRENQAKSKEEGRPIFEDVPYVEIRSPGDKDNIVRKPVTQKIKERFPRHWQAFEVRSEEILIEGTPLTEWPGVTRSQAEELKFFNVYTVEQLATMADSNVQGRMGMTVLKEKAKAYLENADENALKQQLADSKKENEDLKGQMAELMARVNEIDPPKRRGRPPKVTED